MDNKARMGVFCAWRRYLPMALPWVLVHGGIGFAGDVAMADMFDGNDPAPALHVDGGGATVNDPTPALPLEG
ncbi:MAG: hypothetical protein NT040_07065, partial [Bacteroidetes bacterium]|nr:hypothetical protein [Bacteroidota bacterium]